MVVSLRGNYCQMRLLFLLRLAILIFILCWVGYNQIAKKAETDNKEQINLSDKRITGDFSKSFSKIHTPHLSDLITKRTKFRDY